MIPILQGWDTTTAQSVGICRLTDCLRCEVTEARNGEFECEFVYPIGGAWYDEIQLGRLIVASHDATKKPQPFIIYRKEPDLDGNVEFYAHHLSYELNHVVVPPFAEKTIGQTCGIMSGSSVMGGRLNAKTSSNNWTISTDINSTTPYTLSAPSSIRSVLGGSKGSLLDVYGGELKFDWYTVQLLQARGTDSGAVVRYGDNLTDANQEFDEESTFGAVAPYYIDVETETVTQYGLYTASDSANVYPYKVVPLDISGDFESTPTAAQVSTYVSHYFSGHKPWVAFDSLNVSFLPWTMDDTQNTSLQNILLCDTVRVDIPRLNVHTSTKVVKTVYDTLLDRYKGVELGDVRSSFAETILAAASTGGGSVESGGGGGNGIASITFNADYTMTITLDDGAEYTSGSLRGEAGQDGTDGATGPAGPGIASGGTAGQFLVKRSATDYDTEWSNSVPSWLRDALYPVGAVYITMGNTNPSTFLGGTWVKFAAGRTLVGQGEGTDDNGQIIRFNESGQGGEYKHTLTVDEMPAHSHTYNRELSTGDDTGIASARYSGKRSSMNTGSTGGGTAFSLIQPFTTVYFWKRTA